MEKLTFSQYIESKERLLQAIKNTPVTVNVYEVKKYCSLPLGESEDDSQLVGLKPKQKLVVEWHHINVDNPTPNYVRVVGSTAINEDTEHDTFWSGAKLQKWLARHTTKGE